MNYSETISYIRSESKKLGLTFKVESNKSYSFINRTTKQEIYKSSSLDLCLDEVCKKDYLKGIK